MSQWNLSVRLTGQGSNLARTIRDTSRDARAASRDVAQLRRDISLLRQQARNDIRLRVRLDADSLRSDVQDAITSAGAGQGLGVRLNLTNAQDLRREVEGAVRAAASGHRIDIPIGLADSMQLRRDVSAAVRWASMNQTITIRVNPDTSALNRLGGTLNGGGGGDGGSQGALQGLLLLAPAAIPLLAGLSTSLAPLPGQLAAVTAPAAAFGIALAGQIGPLGEAADAEKKYQEAVRDHGTSSAEAVKAQLAYQRTLAALPPEAQKAAIAVSGLKEDFGAWSDDMARFTMKPLTNGIAVLDTIIPRLSPEVETFSTQLDRVIAVAGGAVQTPGFDAMADRFADFTDRQLDDMTDQVMHFLRVLSEGGAFRDGPIAEFMAYAKQNGPEAREALRALSDAVVTLLRGAAEAGPSMLTLVTAAARLVAALPPELVGIILQVATALKLVQLAGAGMAAVAVAVTRVGTSLTGLAATSAAAGGGMAGLRAAFLSLGLAARATLIASGVGILLLVLSELSSAGKNTPPDVDKLTTSLRTLGKTGKVTGEAARSFGKDLSGLADSLQKVTDPKGLDQVQQSIVSFFGSDSTPIKDAKENIDAVDKALADLVKNGQADLAADALDALSKKLKGQGFSADEVRSQMDDYKSALADVAFEQQLAAQSMGLFGKAAQDTQAKLTAQKESADGLRQSIQALNDVNRAGGSAMSAFEQSVDDVAAAVGKHAGALKMSGGELDLGTDKARKAKKALSDLAANTDAATAAAREQGKSWEHINGIYKEGRSAFIQAADDMGLTKTQARALADAYLDIPDEKSTQVQMHAEDATHDLEAFNAQVARSPGTKEVTLKTLSSAAEKILESFGYKVTHLKDGSVQVSARAGQALSQISNVNAALNLLDGKTANTFITTNKVTKFSTVGAPGSSVPVAKRDYADGSVVDYYADGGVRRGGVRHFATGSEKHVAQIAAAGSWRVWGEPETGGEAYVPFAMSKRPRSRRIAEETVRRLGGDPAGIQWNANGSVTDWTYDPQTGSLYSSSDAGQFGHKTRKVKVKGKGGKVTIKEIEYFDLGAVERRIKSTAKVTQAWNKDLEKVADRVGGDVAQALAGMGEDGAKLARKMANGSTKYINEMAAALRNLQKTAKASLGDYTRQLTGANKMNKAFADNLAKLAGQGYGDLASQLAGQNDEAAQQLAASAVKDKGKAAKANAAAKTANRALTADQVSQLVNIIASITTAKTGIHDVASRTGMGEDDIITVANKAKGQIKSSLGPRSARFLSDLAKANHHLSYANGGIRAGMYATQGGIVRFAEPETHGEAYVPLAPSKRSHAMPVLADVASRFGVGLTDASTGRPVVIYRSGDTINVPVTPVRTGASASDIGAQVGRSYRRARRGGVAVHA